ncbi:hypothetical protein D3C71_1541510 [compost metagenome]
MLSSTACKRRCPVRSASTLLCLSWPRASAIRPMRRLKADSSASWESGRVIWKSPWPIWSAARANASIGRPKRWAMLCAVTKPISSIARPIRPSRPAISQARSRASAWARSTAAT